MKLACVQADVHFGDSLANAAFALAKLEELAGHGVDLVLFPEAFLTGYCVVDRESAGQIAIERDHPAIAELAAKVEELGMLAGVGFAEREGERLYNTAVLLESGREPRFYRKTHLPILGYDRFATPGDEIKVFETRFGRIGILICFDQRFPEATRELVLQGAELIVLPTNWPSAATVSASHISIARAAENRVFFASCNRVGTEGGFEFVGLSKIIDPVGTVLAAAASHAEVIQSEIELSVARNKRTVNIPGAYEIDVIGPRRPELYGSLTETVIR